MVSQFKLSELTATDPLLSARLAHVGVGPNNMLQWFAAKGTQMTCATKNLILHLQWPSDSRASESPAPAVPVTPSTPASASTLSPLKGGAGRSPLSRSGSAMSFTARRSLGGVSDTPRRSPRPRMSVGRAALLSQPPTLLAMIETPDVAVGAVDPRKRRVATSTRFSTRAGADRRIFVSTYVERSEHSKSNSPSGRDSASPVESQESDTSTMVDLETPITEIGGAWEAFAEAPEEDETPLSSSTSTKPSKLPAGFKGLASPAMNPMAMALSHEEVVVGCADGTIYVMNFAGYEYGLPKREDPEEEDEEEGVDVME